MIHKLEEILQRLRVECGEGNHDEDVSLTGIMLHNIAVVSMLAGRYQESIEYFQSAVDANKKMFGDEHRLIAVSSSLETRCSYISFAPNSQS